MGNIFKMSNRGGFKSLTDYPDMLAGNTVWNPWAPAGAYDALATVTVPSGGVASVTFAGIPTGYKHLQIRAFWKLANPTNLVGNFNGDTGSNYKDHELYGDGSSASSFVPSVSPTGLSFGYQGGSAFCVSVIDILDYANTNKNKVTRTLFGNDRNGSGDISLGSGLWINTSAVTSLSFKAQDSGAIQQYSQFALYGIK